ncbi:unnamed protein product [Ectocarpus sp. 6 AP-2014]
MTSLPFQWVKSLAVCVRLRADRQRAAARRQRRQPPTSEQRAAIRERDAPRRQQQTPQQLAANRERDAARRRRETQQATEARLHDKVNCKQNVSFLAITRTSSRGRTRLTTVACISYRPL